jgi:hypothetical protein
MSVMITLLKSDYTRIYLNVYLLGRLDSEIRNHLTSKNYNSLNHVNSEFQTWLELVLKHPGNSTMKYFKKINAGREQQS